MSFSVAVRNERGREQDIEVRLLELVRSPGEAPLCQVFVTDSAVARNVGPGAVATVDFELQAPSTPPEPGTYSGVLVAFGQAGGVTRRDVTLTVPAAPVDAEPNPEPVAGLTTTTLPAVYITATNRFPSFLHLSQVWLLVLAGVLTLAAFLGGYARIAPSVRAVFLVIAIGLVIAITPRALVDDEEFLRIDGVPVDPAVAAGSVGTVSSDNGDVGTLVVNSISGNAGEPATAQLTVVGLRRAGSYKGKLDLNGSAAEGTAEATVNVRDWWLWAAIVIAGGVALGAWISSWFQRRRPLNQMRIRIDDLWREVAEDDGAFQQSAAGRPYAVYSLVPYARARLSEAAENLDKDPDDTGPAAEILDRLEQQIARMSHLRQALRLLDEASLDLARRVRTERLGLGQDERVAVLNDANELLTRGLELQAEDADGAAIATVTSESASLTKTVDRIGELHERICNSVAQASDARAHRPPPTNDQATALLNGETTLRVIGRGILLTTNDHRLDELEKEIATPETAIRETWRAVTNPSLTDDEAVLAFPSKLIIPAHFEARRIHWLRWVGESPQPAVGPIEVTVLWPSTAVQGARGDVDDLFCFRVTLSDRDAAMGATWSFGDGTPPVEAVRDTDTGALVGRHQYAKPGSFDVLLESNGQPLSDARGEALERKVEVVGGEGRAARARSALRLLDWRMTLVTGGVAVGSGVLALYYTDSGWGQPDDYLKALLWGSVVSEGLKYTTALATRLWPSG